MSARHRHAGKTSLPGRGSPFLPQDTGQGPANGLEASGRRLGSLTSPASCPSPRRRTPGGPSINWAGPFERRRSRELPGLSKARSWGSRRPPGRRDPCTDVEAVDESLAVRGSVGLQGRRPTQAQLSGMPSLPPQQPVCLSAARPPPSGLRGCRSGGWPPCPPRLPISTQLAAPASGQRSQSLSALHVCLELACPPAVSLDSPALSRLISGSCCCQGNEL